MMSEKIEDQRLELDECTSEESKLTKGKITYTRTCLLSLHDWETCCDLPSDFDPSLLRELYDDGIGVLERPRSECSMSMCSSEDSEYGLSQSFRCNDGDVQEKCSKWDGQSSWLKNKDSNSETNSNPDNSSQESSRTMAGLSSWIKNKDNHPKNNEDPDNERSYEDRHILPSDNPDKDGIQGISAFPVVPQSTAAVSAPEVQVHYQLKKCNNPYRPPHMNKAKNGKVEDTSKSEKVSPVTSSSDEQQIEKQLAKQSTDSEQKREGGMRMNNSTVNLLSSEEVPNDLNCLSLPSSEAISKSEVCVDQENKFTYHGEDKVTGGMTIGISDQDHEGMILEELPGLAVEVQSGTSAILSKNPDFEAENTLGPTLHHSIHFSSCIEEEKGSSSRSSSRKVEGEANGVYDGFVTEQDTTEVFTGRNGPTDKPMPCRLPSATSGDSEQTYSSLTPTETQGILTSANELNVLSDGYESSSIQSHPTKGHNDSEVEYEQLNSANSAAFSEGDMGFSFGPHFKEIESRSISTNQNTRGTETLKPNSEMDFLQDSRPHGPDFSVQIGSFNPNPGQDGSDCSGTQLLDMDDGFLISILDESGAFDMCLDGFLIAILGNSGAFDTSSDAVTAIKVSVDSEENEHEDEPSDYQKIWDRIVLMLRTEQEPKSGPLSLCDGAVYSRGGIGLPDEDCLRASNSTILLNSSEYVSNATSVLPSEKEPNFCVSPDSGEIADFTEICLPDEDSLITVEDLIGPVSLEPLHLNSTAEVHMHDSCSQLSSGQGYTAPLYNIPPKPIRYENTVYYSVLEQPGNLVQPTELHEGVTFPPDPMKQLSSYNDESCTYLYPRNFVQQNYGIQNTDFGGFRGNNSQAVLTGYRGMNVEALIMAKRYQENLRAREFQNSLL